MKEKEIARLNQLKEVENELYNQGIQTIAGIDEAGRGPLAGPVVVACALMPKDSFIEGVNDSKKVAEKKRESIYELIIQQAIGYGVAIIGQKEIDEINILNATKKGVTQCIKDLKENLKTKGNNTIQEPEILLVDALTKIDTDGIPFRSIVHGDAISYSIACASIIAKVTRDRIMRQWDEIYPQYGFAKHKGYGTASHMQAIREYGLSPLHRSSFTTNIE